jgi:transcription antitermination factor NusG
MEKYVKHTPQLTYINYYYNHFQLDNGKNPPLTIPYEDMMNFIRVSSIKDEHVMVVEQEHCHYKSGDNVLVTQGKFEGVRGKVARICGQQRVVVNLEGVCMVATAYIPSAFIQIID